MKRNEKNWVLLVLLTALVVGGMSVPAFSSPGPFHKAGGGFNARSCPASAVPRSAPINPSVAGEPLPVMEAREPFLDDASQDSMDESRIPCESMESALSCAGPRLTAGSLLDYLAEEGLATQMVCCAWRC